MAQHISASNDARRLEELPEVLLPVAYAGCLRALSRPKHIDRVAVERGEQFFRYGLGNRHAHMRTCFLPGRHDAMQLLCLIKDDLIPPQGHGVTDGKPAPAHKLYQGADACGFARPKPMMPGECARDGG